MRSTTGHTFGGYASAPWKITSGNYINAPGCFLFLVENAHGDAPTCFDCNDLKHAMDVDSDWGPTFGYGGSGGSDLYITSDGTSSWTNFPNSYRDTLGRGIATFTGAKFFTPEDYEVWAVK